MPELNQRQTEHDGLDKKMIERVQSILLLILDVDGVMTDGKIIMDDAGRETKNFNVKDGHGIKMLIRYGVDVAIVTGRKSGVIEHRARDLGITEVHQNILNKVEVLNGILRNRNLNHEQVAYIGDDVVDIPLLRRVGFSAAVADAVPEVKASVNYITKKTGGNGAVREICDLILQCQGKWENVIQKYDIA